MKEDKERNNLEGKKCSRNVIEGGSSSGGQVRNKTL